MPANAQDRYCYNVLDNICYLRHDSCFNHTESDANSRAGLALCQVKLEESKQHPWCLPYGNKDLKPSQSDTNKCPAGTATIGKGIAGLFAERKTNPWCLDLDSRKIFLSNNKECPGNTAYLEDADSVKFDKMTAEEARPFQKP